MATRKPVNVKCPQCDKESTFSVWMNIDSMEDPMLKQQILDGTLFDFKCPYCEYSVALHYDVLFNMPDHGTMLHMIANPDQASQVPIMIEEQEKMLSGQELQNAKLYIHRVVNNIYQLREKAMIFENDLDDRVIELMKIIYSGQFHEQRGVEPEYIFFGVNAQLEKNFEFYDAEGALLAIAPVDMNLYKSIQHSPQRKLKPIRTDRLYFVNKEWALNSVR